MYNIYAYLHRIIVMYIIISLINKCNVMRPWYPSNVQKLQVIHVMYIFTNLFDVIVHCQATSLSPSSPRSPTSEAEYRLRLLSDGSPRREPEELSRLGAFQSPGGNKAVAFAAAFDALKRRHGCTSDRGAYLMRAMASAPLVFGAPTPEALLRSHPSSPSQMDALASTEAALPRSPNGRSPSGLPHQPPSVSLDAASPTPTSPGGSQRSNWNPTSRAATDELQEGDAPAEPRDLRAALRTARAEAQKRGEALKRAEARVLNLAADRAAARAETARAHDAAERAVSAARAAEERAARAGVAAAATAAEMTQSALQRAQTRIDELEAEIASSAEAASGAQLAAEEAVASVRRAEARSEALSLENASVRAAALAARAAVEEADARAASLRAEVVASRAATSEYQSAAEAALAALQRAEGRIAIMGERNAELENEVAVVQAAFRTLAAAAELAATEAEVAAPEADALNAALASRAAAMAETRTSLERALSEGQFAREAAAAAEASARAARADAAEAKRQLRDLQSEAARLLSMQRCETDRLQKQLEAAEAALRLRCAAAAADQDAAQSLARGETETRLATARLVAAVTARLVARSEEGGRGGGGA